MFDTVYIFNEVFVFSPMKQQSLDPSQWFSRHASVYVPCQLQNMYLLHSTKKISNFNWNNLLSIGQVDEVFDAIM